MEGHAGRTVSVWMATASLPPFGPLQANEHADVCVIGAGIAGLSVAYFLAKTGKSVIVLDDGPIASGETERTTAHLSTALDDRYVGLERVHGERGARLAAESHAVAIDTIERIVTEERIDCDFARLDGYLFNDPDGAPDLLERELEAAHRAGLEDVELVERAPLISYHTGQALLFPRQGQLHPLKYLAGLALAIVRRGGRIFVDTHATGVHGGASPRVTTRDGKRIACRAIVVATNTPINDRIAIHTRQTAYRTYVVGLTVPVGTVPKVLYWDTADPYHYVRLQPALPNGPKPSRDLLIVGGEDHRTGQANDAELRFGRLEQWTRARFPMAADVRFRWSGQVMEPTDGLAFIGHSPVDEPNVYIATGDSGHGMTHGTIAGLLLTDLIEGRANRWESLYDPSRHRRGDVEEFVRDNANIAAQYVDWITGGDVNRETLIPPESGAIVRHGLVKVAVYRDEAGKFHECSATCPHLGGIVAWNEAEKTWDCPVHGSRFDCLGRVLNGPANADLQPLPVHAD